VSARKHWRDLISIIRYEYSSGEYGTWRKSAFQYGLRWRARSACAKDPCNCGNYSKNRFQIVKYFYDIANLSDIFACVAVGCKSIKLIRDKDRLGSESRSLLSQVLGSAADKTRFPERFYCRPECFKAIRHGSKDAEKIEFDIAADPLIYLGRQTGGRGPTHSLKLLRSNNRRTPTLAAAKLL
jgi:hypothetical protein